ncbi:MAG: CRISPR-associated endoribonuclease Cas6 [Candidatus Nitrosocaldus sp.]|nr:hypothetical protein [Candidatus Nitrosocaldus sp.]MDW8275665.1 CRISPR-associated endoribonuclease Cas6 [Candidatus Nitrosocaldus sp.]
MRLLLALESARDQEYQLDYHYSVQGFIYNMLRGSSFEHLHDRDGYKFFCFSNIFPYSSMMKKGDRRNLLISSPSADLIMHIDRRVRAHRHAGDVIGIGDMRFLLKGSKMIHYPLSMKQFTLVTATPIVVRIARDKYSRFNIRPRHDYEYLYWRKDHPLDLFIEQLEDNLFKKYKEYTGLDIEDEVMAELEDDGSSDGNGDGKCNIGNGTVEMSKSSSSSKKGRKGVKEYSASGHLINRLRFIKQVAKEISMHGNRHIVIGTLWTFWFNIENYNRCDAILKLLQFALDAGFGERNSLGFGFMNIIHRPLIPE